jgi:hypothetical protein
LLQLRRLFIQSFTDEAIFPPRCHEKPIYEVIFVDDGPHSKLLSQKIEDQTINELYLAKLEEFGTQDRTYCSNATCAAFLKPGSIDAATKTATCPKCKVTTCALCKNGRHESEDCPKDPAVQLTVELATKEGWRKCPKCSHYVELGCGCNHVTYI